MHVKNILSSPTKMNRLANAKSPYLLQHATNPVDWHEWTPSAFDLARSRNVPIFLSVGYSACHWCHVLAHESFENEGVAKIMNENFVNIKVDREERPDVDSLYMMFLQATTGGGGWPMSVFLTPSLQPFFAGTYFQREQFLRLLNQITDLWSTKPEDVLSTAENIMAQLRSSSAAAQSAVSSSESDQLRKIASQSSSKLYADLSRRFDPKYGGFSMTGPKFPSPAQTLEFLTTYAALPTPSSPQTSGEVADLLKERGPETKRQAAHMSVRTLRGIWEGGMRDHVGGGCARYSVDEKWHVPHFEKMLYDQAQLAYSALSLSLLPPSLLASPEENTSGDVVSPQYTPAESNQKMLRDMAVDILEYTQRDLRDKRSGGAFWSAEDADSKESFDPSHSDASAKIVPTVSSPSVEGAFYVWTAKEIEDVLENSPLATKLDHIHVSDIFNARYGVEEKGNVDPKSDIQGELKGKNVLYHAASISELQEGFGLPEEQIVGVLDESVKILKAWRDEHRPRPHLDDKVVAGWNGLMISAYALASTALPSDGTYPIRTRALEIAEHAAQFVQREMIDLDTLEMCRTWRDGYKGPRAQADDYAFFIRGLLDLYEASGKESYLVLAIRLQDKQDSLFWDEENGGYFTSVADEHILIRQKDAQDGAEPSAASVTIANLSRLSQYDSSRLESYTTRIERTFNTLSSLLEQAPRALANSVAALIRHQAGHRQFIVLGSPESRTFQGYLNQINSKLMPNRILIHIDPENPPRELVKRNEVIKAIVDEVDRNRAERKAIVENVRLCEGFTCQLPVVGHERVQRLIDED